MTTTPKAPSHFTEKTRKLWKGIHAQYELEPEAAELLRVALENLDLADQARELLRNEGLVVAGKKHPASDAVKLHDGCSCERFANWDSISWLPDLSGGHLERRGDEMPRVRRVGHKQRAAERPLNEWSADELRTELSRLGIDPADLTAWAAYKRASELQNELGERGVECPV